MGLAHITVVPQLSGYFCIQTRVSGSDRPGKVREENCGPGILFSCYKSGNFLAPLCHLAVVYKKGGAQRTAGSSLCAMIKKF